MEREGRSGGGAQMKRWLLAALPIFFKLILADIVCAYVAPWVIYGLLLRRRISKPKIGKRGELEVIICGISRSGSTSLQDAMDRLGFSCFHGVNLMNPTQCKLFMKAYKTGNKDDWDHLLDGYTAIAGFPAACCYKQLMKLYPEAKVILNIRDPQRWYKSFSTNVLKFTQMEQILCPSIFTACVKEVLYDGMLNGNEEDKGSAISSYNLHTQAVIAHERPSRRLLVYEFGDSTQGWAPICEFLQVGIPQVPFPISNDSKTFQRLIIMCATIRSLVVVLYCTLLYFVFAFLMSILL